MNVSVQLIEGYSRIYGLNGFCLSNPKEILYKYTPLNRLLENIEKKELIFVSPNTWYDPFERLYFHTDCSNHQYQTEEIACMCLTSECTINEEAAWRIYADGNKKSVRLSIESDILFRLLENFGIEHQCKIYVGKAIYDYNKDGIRQIGSKKSSLHSLFCPDIMKTEHYLSLMLLKRKSFKYENEIRIFIVKDKNLYIRQNLLSIPCEYDKEKLISKVTLSPYPTVDPHTQLGKLYAKLHEIESKELKLKLKSDLGCRIEQSHLYDYKGTCTID